MELHFLGRFLAVTAILVLAVSARHWQSRAVRAKRQLPRIKQRLP